MGSQRLARQLKTQPLRVAGEACRRPGGIEQCHIAHSELRDLVVLGQRRPTGGLKYGIVVIRADEASIPLRPRGSVSIATEFRGREPAFDLERSRV
jgi:hypothetical protein